jgi:replicative DNA helicase
MTRPELEIMIASQVLQEPSLLQRLTVPVDQFGDWEAAYCLRAVESLETKGMKVTRHDVAAEVERLDRARVAEIWNTAPTRENFNAHVGQLWEMIKRDKLGFLQTIIADGLSSNEKPSKTIQRVEEYLMTIEDAETIYRQVSIGQALRESVERFEGRLQNPGLPGVTTGYSGLNRMFGGFEAGKLYYVGARPSQGKTALMLNFAVHALSANVPIGIVSVESSERELADRIIANKGSIDSMILRDGKGATRQHLGRLQTVVERFYQTPGVVYHNPRATVSDVAIQIRRMVKNRNIKVAFVDYVQLIDGGKRNTRQEEVAHVSRNLKAIASDADVAVVALAQLRRDADGHAPTMADLAEASALEKDADVVMAIHHEEQASSIRVLKARDGLTGVVQVMFERKFLRFGEVDMNPRNAA